MQSNILFVDDDPSVLDALEWTFADEPYSCMMCKTPGEALRLMDEIDFAVVVSDQRMPDMSGTDFLQRIKRQWPETIRILMTAYQEMNIILNAVNKGHVYNLIFKPWDESELKRIIQTAVDDYSVRNNNGPFCRQVSESEQMIELNTSLEKKNQALMKRLQQAQKMETLGNLSSGIAHDFNTILFIINSSLQMAMADKSSSHNVREHLSQALRASSRAKDLVAQIRSFSRAGENSKQPFPLRPLVEEVVEFIQAAMGSSVEIRQEITVGPEMIQLEPTKVYQILMNLCSNAADAMKGGRGVVAIKLTRTHIVDADPVEQVKLLSGNYFCLTVSDNGDGIDNSDIARIFDPYFTTKLNNGGTGLGLALINQIVQDQGGRISVSSELGNGTSFTIYLPLLEESYFQVPLQQ